MTSQAFNRPELNHHIGKHIQYQNIFHHIKMNSEKPKTPQTSARESDKTNTPEGASTGPSGTGVSATSVVYPHPRSASSTNAFKRRRIPKPASPGSLGRQPRPAQHHPPPTKQVAMALRGTPLLALTRPLILHKLLRQISGDGTIATSYG